MRKDSGLLCLIRAGRYRGSPSLVVAGIVCSVIGVVSTGCAPPVREVAPPNPLPVKPTVYTDANRTVSPSNEVPVAVNFKSTTQLKLQATQHWTKIAEDAAQSLVPTLRKSGRCGTSFDPCKSIAVTPPSVVTEFSRAFYQQVTTTLVKAGLQVARNPPADLLVDIDIQPIAFAPNRPQYRHAGVATQLGPGVWALRDVVSVDPKDDQANPPTVDALHWFRSEFASGQTPQLEILVTLSIGSKDFYVARSTNAYYVADSDLHLYNQEICSLFRLCPAKTEATAPPAKEKNLPKVAPKPELEVVGDCPLDKACPPANSNNITIKGQVKGGGR